MTLVALGTKTAKVFSAFILSGDVLVFLPHPNPVFYSPSARVLLELLPAKQSQDPSVLLWKEWRHHLRVYERKKERKE